MKKLFCCLILRDEGKNTRVIAVEILDLSMRNIRDSNIYKIKNNGIGNNELYAS
jgi:hypothetical protein